MAKNQIYTVRCDICFEPIALVNPSELLFPMIGSMFQSLEPDREIPPPFAPGLEWEFMKCPYCGFRPFVGDDKVTVVTEAGKDKLIRAKRREEPKNKGGKQNGSTSRSL